jgi:hypothetical protein
MTSVERGTAPNNQSGCCGGAVSRRVRRRSGDLGDAALRLQLGGRRCICQPMLGIWCLAHYSALTEAQRAEVRNRAGVRSRL